ncbi:uncharacterized protein CELE_Y73B3A.20 [Caenorhabditis elegans]|uniref:Uncharacterized protein n=1 Tax=Caenorhabditis elegans TaxID=6239 RepID=Q95XE3_CAEEL|nr:Uncharacterized protein CELE_Y73B3A.20 [Caenorhabditis elegans]CCD74441.1 Uncharacterized protein CELE_Y73B3A.20 [Caenorhabditis elegans]|eukprot:NP_508080.2 Uncharacterized protein CELE_Y73B3A.20 [Caenorhabditis elegans]
MAIRRQKGDFTTRRKRTSVGERNGEASLGGKIPNFHGEKKPDDRFHHNFSLEEIELQCRSTTHFCEIWRETA